MLKHNNSDDSRNGISNSLLQLAKQYWKDLPSLLKRRIVKETYHECGSLRKAAKKLGISKTTVYHYTRYKDPFCYVSSSGIDRELLKTTSSLLIQQLTRLDAGDDETHKMQGGENLE